MNIIITGTSSGIGWGLANYYLSQGHNVFGVARRNPLDLMQNENYHHLQMDLLQFSKIEEELEQLVGNQSLDLAILNAGILGEITDLKEQSINKLKHIMDVNLWSNKAFIDALLNLPNQPNKFIAISSGAAVNGNRGWGGYSISKAALNMLIQLYASENPDKQFYAFAPGLVDTAMQDYLCSGELDSDQFPSAKKLMAARGTENMPNPEIAGKILAQAFDQITEPSGSFLDIRNK